MPATNRTSINVPEPEEGDEEINITVGPADNTDVQNAALKAGYRMEIGPDGSVSFHDLDEEEDEAPPRNNSFDANIAEDAPEYVLSEVATDLLEGIEADEMTRALQVNTYTENMDMMGLVIEKESGSGSVSRVRHPVLLESVVKFQSAAGAEMLPAAGPVKVQNDGGDGTQEDQLANDFQKDFNHYLTTTATEFYPDTDRMNFYLAYGGCTFKKIYRCPVRQRPVSEAVLLPDFIVSNDCTDIQNALRATHRLRYLKSEVMRFQMMGIWRECDLTAPVSSPTTTQVKEAQISGVQAQAPRPQDAQRIVYECYTELDLARMDKGLKEKGAPKKMPLPYRVTLDKESRQVLEIRRDWKDGDKMFRRKRHFVKYGLIPGFGFYDLGYLHLIGNQTKALTAIWRILVDAGMFSNFPGGVLNDTLRTNNSMIRPNPGEFVPIKVGTNQDIQKAFMPLPYKEPSAVLLQLAEVIGEDAQRMGSNVQLEVGEGRTNVPVGTIMAQIEQQTQVMQAVHKRLHRAQKEEFILLRDLFIEDPTALWRYDPKKAQRKWQIAEEFSDLDLVPASDPNVPSTIHRIMLAVALAQLAGASGPLYDQAAVQRRLLTMVNITNPDELLMTPEKAAANGTPPEDPKVTAEKIKAQSQAEQAAAKTTQAQAAAQRETQRAGAEATMQQRESADQAADRQNRLEIAQTHEETERLRANADVEADRSKSAVDVGHLQNETLKTHHEIEHGRAEMGLAAAEHQHTAQMDHAQHGLAAREQQHAEQTGQAEIGLAHQQQQHEQQTSQQEMGLAARKTEHEITTGQKETGLAEKKTKSDIQTAKAGMNGASKPKKGKST